MPSPRVGLIAPRKWAWILISSSLTLAICSWLFYRNRNRNRSCTEPHTSLFGQTWAWLRWFAQKPTISSTPLSLGNSPPASASGASSNAILDTTAADSAFPVDSALETLSRARISGNPRVVVLSTRHTIFTAGEGEKLELLPGALESLRLWFTKRRGLDLYLITQCAEDSTELIASQLLQQAAIYGLRTDKLLFCSTTQGLQHMARQIGPDLFIDSSLDNLVAAAKWATSRILLGSQFPQAYPNLLELVNSV